MNVGQVKRALNIFNDTDPVVLHMEADEYHEVDVVKKVSGEVLLGFRGTWVPPDEDEPTGAEQYDLAVIDTSF